MDILLIADKAHETESLISDFKDTGFDEKNKLIIKNNLSEIGAELNQIGEITSRFSSFGKISGISITSRIEQFFVTLKRMAGQISKELDKDTVLVTRSNLVDFPYLKQMRDPIIHLIRNSLDHGIEDSFERLSSGKEKTAVLKLEIGVLKDGSFSVVVADDGRGIDFNSVRKRALEKGLIGNSDISDKDLVEMLFSSSFSTKSEISSISGRGVGLDVVSEVVKSLNGTISIATTKAKGTKFIIKLPSVKTI